MRLPKPTRLFVYFFLLGGAAWLFSAFNICLGAPTQNSDLVRYVNPLIGTDSSPELSRGNTYPAIALPFGMTAWTPQTGEWRWLYTYRAEKFQGLRATHQPSPWVGDYGQFTLMPISGSLKLKAGARAARFRHEHEQARPYYYSVTLDNGIRAELTPTRRCAFLRFTFPKSDSAYLVLDLSAGPTSVQIWPEQKKITGWTRVNSGGVPDNFACYFVLNFDQEFAAFGLSDSAQVRLKSSQLSEQPGFAFVRFNTPGKKPVQVRVATSFISADQAEANLRTEIDNRNFAQVKKQAEATWNQELNRIQIEGASPAQRITFYTAFYRTLLFPRVFHELDPDGILYHYSPYDGQVHPGEMYVDNGFWDTFRAVFPFFTLLMPERDAEMIRGFINSYRQGGWFPRWTSPGYRDGMIGTHSASIIADAYVKGIRNFAAEAAYQGMRKDAVEPSRVHGTGRAGIQYFKQLGYVPADKVAEATARTLEYAYDDFCVAQMASALGKDDDHRWFTRRAYNYKNVFDPTTCFMRGRKASGAWLTPFSPIEWGGAFTEGNAWHYTWSVMHDVQGLINLMGGREKFLARLDQLFIEPPAFKVGSYGREIHEMTEMVLANMGQYAHGNQPVHHVVYLFNYAGEPWKTQYWVRRVLDELYGPGPDGLIGDEDNGQMSAWYIFSALGFYPVTPGVPAYVLGAPLFKKITLNLENGRQLVIQAPKNSARNKYVQALWLNERAYDANWIFHKDLSQGGTLRFDLGPEPNKNWGSAPEQVPFSLTPGPGVAIPYLVGDSESFVDSTTVVLACTTPDAEIHYTLDGSEPTLASPVYSQPIRIRHTTLIQARAFQPPLLPSPILEARMTRLEFRDPDRPGNLIPGLTYAYYEGAYNQLPDFQDLTPVQTGRLENIDLAVRRRDDDFALRFTGFIEIKQKGLYTFYTASDDGSQLFIGDQLVVDNDGLHGYRETNGDIALHSGYHALTVTFFERTGAENLLVSLKGPGLAQQPLPAALLYTRP